MAMTANERTLACLASPEHDLPTNSTTRRLEIVMRHELMIPG